MKTCPDAQHRFVKFDDATIFCQRCGEQRVMDVQALIGQLPVPTYLPCPQPHYPYRTGDFWYPWWGTTTITYDTITTGSTTGWTGGNVSFT